MLNYTPEVRPQRVGSQQTLDCLFVRSVRHAPEQSLILYICMYVCVCVCVCIYIYTHTYIHIHTYIHTCIHTYDQTQFWSYISIVCLHILQGQNLGLAVEQGLIHYQTQFWSHSMWIYFIILLESMFIYFIILLQGQKPGFPHRTRPCITWKSVLI
jgi:hypothetical protein